MSGHVLVIGGTRSGKSYWTNHLHRTYPHVSIYFNFPRTAVWGTKVNHPAQVPVALKRDRKINYIPPFNVTQAKQHLDQLVALLFKIGQGASYKWCQIIIDEAHLFARSQDDDSSIVTVATTGLGHAGIRAVYITQHPKGLNTTIRTNCQHRVMFKPGHEASLFLRNQAWPGVDQVLQHANNTYHFARYDGTDGPFLHTPI